MSVVCPDLRGYGQSSTPEPDAEHHVYSDRAMAGDIASLMQQLGHERFSVVGHDRGSYVAYRTALDHTFSLLGGEEEPVPPQFGEASIRALERLHDGDTVKDGKFLHLPGVIECRAVGDVAAPVVADDAKAFMP